MPIFVTAPFVFVLALLKNPTGLAAEAWASRDVCQILQLAFRVFFPRAHEPPRR